MDNWRERLFVLLASEENAALARLLCLCTGATLGFLWSCLVGA